MWCYNVFIFDGRSFVGSPTKLPQFSIGAMIFTLCKPCACRPIYELILVDIALNASMKWFLFVFSSTLQMLLSFLFKSKQNVYELWWNEIPDLMNAIHEHWETNTWISFVNSHAVINIDSFECVAFYNLHSIYLVSMENQNTEWKTSLTFYDLHWRKNFEEYKEEETVEIRTCAVQCVHVNPIKLP